jgi:hypothetical protein
MAFRRGLDYKPGMADSDETTGEVPRRRYFTPGEANALLPEMAARMTAIGEHLRRARTVTDALRVVSDGTPEHQRAIDDIDALRVEIERLVDEIHDEGVDVKGLSPGLLDFPAIMNGQEVYLCWKEGEDRIDWWHPLHTGIAGRQKLDLSGHNAWEWNN